MATLEELIRKNNEEMRKKATALKKRKIEHPPDEELPDTFPRIHLMKKEEFKPAPVLPGLPKITSGTIVSFSISDDLNERFRKKVAEKFGYRKGNIKKAVEEAIEKWINGP
jgi:hypothetical protein